MFRIHAGRLDGGLAQQPEAAQALVTDGHPPVVAAGCRCFAYTLAAWMAASRSSRRLLKRTPTGCRLFAYS